MEVPAEAPKSAVSGVKLMGKYSDKRAFQRRQDAGVVLGLRAITQQGHPLFDPLIEVGNHPA